MPYHCTLAHYLGTSEPEKTHRERHYYDCHKYWLDAPSTSPTRSGSPTKTPTALPSALAIQVFCSLHQNHSLKALIFVHLQIIAPTKLPTVSPTKSPTVSPTTNHPSPTPSISAKPSLIEYYEVRLPEFELQLVVPLRRRLMNTYVTDDDISSVLAPLLNTAYKTRYADFKLLNLDVHDKKEVTEADQTTVTFPFEVNCVFASKNPATIPSESALTSATVLALVGADARQAFDDASSDTFSSISIRRVGSSEATFIENGDLRAQKAPSSTNIVPTVIASVIAVFSTLTALGLIFAQRRKMEEEIAASPSKPANEVATPKGLRKIRSPFALTATPADGTRKYFCRLDDESVSSRSQNNGYLNADVSIVNSSFSRDEESSLEAPSMAGLSSICEGSKAGDSMRSLDGESYANMSALDEVRLGRVLDLEGSLVDEHSLTTVSDSGSKLERKSTFAKLWSGRRKQKANAIPSPGESDETVTLSPKIASSAQSLVSPSPYIADAESESESETESVLQRKDADDNSLLGNQSDKGSYYDQNEETSPFFSMLGERSDNSMESESVDFNEMYAAETSSFEESSTGGSSKMSTALASVQARVAGD
eukprot:scaffold2135_cov271-Chaetoceros_neogracile.AAC.6